MQGIPFQLFDTNLDLLNLHYISSKQCFSYARKFNNYQFLKLDKFRHMFIWCWLFFFLGKLCIQFFWCQGRWILLLEFLRYEIVNARDFVVLHGWRYDVIYHLDLSLHRICLLKLAFSCTSHITLLGYWFSILNAYRLYKEHYWGAHILCLTMHKLA